MKHYIMHDKKYKNIISTIIIIRTIIKINFITVVIDRFPPLLLRISKEL